METKKIMYFDLLPSPIKEKIKLLSEIAGARDAITYDQTKLFGEKNRLSLAVLGFQAWNFSQDCSKIIAHVKMSKAVAFYSILQLYKKEQGEIVSFYSEAYPFGYLNSIDKTTMAVDNAGENIFWVLTEHNKKTLYHTNHVLKQTKQSTLDVTSVSGIACLEDSKQICVFDKDMEVAFLKAYKE